MTKRGSLDLYSFAKEAAAVRPRFLPPGMAHAGVLPSLIPTLRFMPPVTPRALPVPKKPKPPALQAPGPAPNLPSDFGPYTRQPAGNLNAAGGGNYRGLRG